VLLIGFLYISSYRVLLKLDRWQHGAHLCLPICFAWVSFVFPHPTIMHSKSIRPMTVAGGLYMLVYYKVILTYIYIYIYIYIDRARGSERERERYLANKPTQGLQDIFWMVLRVFPGRFACVFLKHVSSTSADLCHLSSFIVPSEGFPYFSNLSSRNNGSRAFPCMCLNACQVSESPK